VNQALIRAVWTRANRRCEYCHMPSSTYAGSFHVDHVVARQHGGGTTLENLALACLHCNQHKGPNLAGIDPKTGEIVSLFHPRRDRWPDHFEWDDANLVGRTEIGRATIQVLAMNDPAFRAVRIVLLHEGSEEWD
jgi:hypothetical protein